MWSFHYSRIDDELLGRLKKKGFEFTVKDWKFTGGGTTHNYFINDKQCFTFACNPSGKISGNGYIAAPVKKDPRGAVLVQGRPKSWGKRVLIDLCGDTESEQFDYIADLIAQVADDSQKRNIAVIDDSEFKI